MINSKLIITLLIIIILSVILHIILSKKKKILNLNHQKQKYLKRPKLPVSKAQGSKAQAKGGLNEDLDFGRTSDFIK